MAIEGLPVNGLFVSGGGGCFGGLCGSGFHNLSHETKASSMHCPDCRLMMTIVAHRLSRRPDAAGNAGVRHTLPVPDLFDDLVLGHHSVVVAYKETKKRKNLRLQPHQLCTAGQLKPFGVKSEVTKNPRHATRYRKIAAFYMKSSELNQAYPGEKRDIWKKAGHRASLIRNRGANT